jgi:hypothetical protein
MGEEYKKNLHNEGSEKNDAPGQKEAENQIGSTK